MAQSTGLLADALDMLSDVSAYAIGLIAIGRSARFKANAAYGSGGLLLLLGVSVLVEVGRRAIYGSDPVNGWMIGVGLLSLLVNMAVENCASLCVGDRRRTKQRNRSPATGPCGRLHPVVLARPLARV